MAEGIEILISLEDKLSGPIKNIIKNLENLKKVKDSLIVNFEKFTSSLNKTVGSFDQMKKQSTNISSGFNEVSSSTKGFADSMNSLQVPGTILAESTNVFQKNIEASNKAIMDFDPNITKINDSYMGLVDSFSSVNKALIAGDKEFANLQKAMETTGKGIKGINFGFLGIGFLGMQLSRTFGFLNDEIMKVYFSGELMNLQFTLIGAAAPYFEALSDIFYRLADVFYKLPEATQAFLGFLFPLISTLGSVMSEVGFAIFGFQQLAGVLGITKAMMIAFGASVFVALPYLLALVAAVALMYYIFELFGIQMSLTDAILYDIPDRISAIIEAFSPKNIGTTLTDWLTDVNERIGGLFNIDNITQGITDIGTRLDELIGTPLTEWWNKSIKWVQDTFTWENLIKTFSDIGTWLDTNIYQPIVKWWGDGVKWVQDNFNLTKLLSMFGTIGPWLEDNIYKPIKKWFDDAVVWVQTNFTWSKLMSLFGTIGTWLTNTIYTPIKNTYDSIVKWFQDNFKWSKLTEFFGNVFNWGVELVNSMVSGIKSVGSALSNAILNLIPEPFKTAIKNLAGIPTYTDVIWRAGQKPIAISPKDNIIATRGGGGETLNFAPTINISANLSGSADVNMLGKQLMDSMYNELRRRRM